MNNTYLNLRIIIADDHEMVRKGLHTMIKEIDSIEIVGEAGNGEELIKLTRSLVPDVLLVDVKMPKCNGIEATKIIKKEYPQIGIVALSSFDEEQLILDMLNAGAKGYLLKNAGRQEILDAANAVYRDEPYYSKEINYKLAQMVARGGPFSGEKKVADDFNEKELAIIEMICDGMSSKQIADVMGFRSRTIERYRDIIMDKMDVKNAAALVMFAIKNKLYKGGDK